MRFFLLETIFTYSSPKDFSNIKKKKNIILSSSNFQDSYLLCRFKGYPCEWNVKLSYVYSPFKWRSIIYILEKLLVEDVLSEEGRPAAIFSRPSHILLIFSSEPYKNPRPSNNKFRGGSEEKMRKMWLWIKIGVASLSSLSKDCVKSDVGNLYLFIIVFCQSKNW